MREQLDVSPALEAAGTAPSRLEAEALTCVHTFVDWLDTYGELSQDPYDFWATGLGTRAKTLYYDHRLLGSLAAAPFVGLDLLAPQTRRFVRRPARAAIADAHYALGFFVLARVDGESRHADRGRRLLGELERSRSLLSPEPAWGYPFDWASRYGVYQAGSPLMTTIPYCYEAFKAGHAATGDGTYLKRMEGIARFAAEQIPVTRVEPGVEAAAYSPFDHRQVVNASAYRAFLLASAGAQFERTDWLEASLRNLAFVVRSQRADGSWPYSVDGEDDFVDNFHTCLVLKNLAKVLGRTGSQEARDVLVAGYDFYLRNLLDDDGLPVPFARRPRLTLHRRDLYDYAEGVTLAGLVRSEIPAAERVRERLVRDLVERWALPDGHFATRRLVVGRNTLPYHRWAQSQTFHALVTFVAGD
jgi:hypothetical protein